MKTLLTENQVEKIHKGDNHSARMKVKVGEIHSSKGRYYFCVEKSIFKINKCPHCGSTTTYHSRQQKNYSPEKKNNYDNVFRTIERQDKKFRYYFKFDYCLVCHNEFLIEYFIYKKVPLDVIIIAFIVYQFNKIKRRFHRQ